jgi:U2 small nuclear ribonucleoprotein B''
MASTSSSSTVPNHTLYVSYIYDKLNKETTRKVLYALFSQFGRVIDVVHSKTLRGRAWVVFEDVSMATQAKVNLEGFELYGKGIRIAYAKTKSDAVAKLDGSWRGDGRTRRVRYGVDGEGDEEMEEDLKQGEKQKGGSSQETVDVGRPNKTLFVENLPVGTKEEMLKVLFGQFPGFSGARMVPGKSSLAFVDFAGVGQAGIALQGLQGFKIGSGCEIRLTYAKGE